MKVEKINLRPDDDRLNHEPSISVSNSGCGLDHCHCSDGYWLNISDGKTLLLATLTKKEFEKLFGKGKVLIDLGPRETDSDEPNLDSKLREFEKWRDL